MIQLVKDIVFKLGDKLADVLICLTSAVREFFQYKNRKLDEKNRKEAEAKKEKTQTELEKVVDSGTLDDLLDAVRKNSVKTVVAAFMLFSCGCISRNIEIQPTNAWEGRYSDCETALEALRGCRLERGQSIWILSNRTLKRVLLENGKSEK